eukprot:CAMPEP_0172173254 /NCGR_PEP_ID=MMETSP1050-20130122/12934_1 /TAXON_ID=233186 /ORGANISM="Cryptomonas curvata, Strain CCAP979/52" /LENGTH=53 /DNA_ID=CAMNT_0012844953 /DNA_START=10 /DNA_END=171 /DNA_ORIENTATION=-
MSMVSELSTSRVMVLPVRVLTKICISAAPKRTKGETTKKACIKCATQLLKKLG